MSAEPFKAKKIKLELTTLDVETLLIALGEMQHRMYDSGTNSRSVAVLIDKVYRAMGVRL